MKKIYLRSFGCQMNEYDSELAAAILDQAGFALTPNQAEADIVLLNTCSVRDNAHRKVLNEVHSIRQRNNGRPLTVGILGCMATVLGEKLLENRKLKIDFLAGPDSYKRLPEIITECLASHQSPVTSHKQKQYDITLSECETYSDIAPLRENSANAWVAVMRGCDNFCSFCVVPYARGRERSRTVENILQEVQKAVKEGCPQVTLLGQNVNSYHDGEADFADLLSAVSRVEGIERIRFMSPHPKDFPEKLLYLMAETPKICKHIHLPLQAGNTRILKLMNRKYTQKDYLELVKKIRTIVPAAALTTDVIVGFPTETDEEFDDTLKILRDVEFDSAFIFKYSPRPKTFAAKKYTDDVPADKKTQRIVRLNELQKKISLNKNRACIGQTFSVLIESKGTAKSPKEYQGRMDNNKIVIIPSGNYSPGQFFEVTITDVTAHILKGKPASANQPLITL